MHIPLFIWGIFNIRLSFFCETLCSKKNEKKSLALTFDDGPDPAITPDILDLLDKYNLKATFFMIAKNVLLHPQLAQEVSKRGHTIACHDLNHDLTTNFRMTKKMLSDISEAQKIIQNTTGKKPLLYRPPVGLTNPHLRVALKKLNMTCIGWNKSVKDAGNRRSFTFKNIPGLASPGAVILLHDTMPDVDKKDEFLFNLKILFGNIKEEGYLSVGVDTFFSIKAYE
jgi:peptidoglycan/xylan/chitin deacetylase (PgdA/CDA1 family)